MDYNFLEVKISQKLSDFNLDIDFSVINQNITVILGPSGAGKSLTLKSIAGLNKFNGFVKLYGENIEKKPPFLRKIVYLPQGNSLFENLTVYENLVLSYRVSKKTIDKPLLKRVVNFFQINNIIDRGVKNLSGGEAQRVALARSIFANPILLLLDEPFSSLDINLKYELIEFLKNIVREFETKILLVTHDPFEAKILGDKIIYIEKGNVIFSGKWNNFINEDNKFVSAYKKLLTY